MQLMTNNNKTMSSREIADGLLSTEEFKVVSDFITNNGPEPVEVSDDLIKKTMKLGAAMHTMLKALDYSIKGMEESSISSVHSSWDLANHAELMLKSMGIDVSPYVFAISGHMVQIISSVTKDNQPEKVSEADYRDELVANFDSYFPDYIYINHEVKVDVDDRDRIDILAEKEDGDPVIIELKLGSKSAHKQLRSYATGFDDPLLINISEVMPSNMRRDIVYITFESLGVFKN
mgnify:FL=1